MNGADIPTDDHELCQGDMLVLTASPAAAVGAGGVVPTTTNAVSITGAVTPPDMGTSLRTDSEHFCSGHRRAPPLVRYNDQWPATTCRVTGAPR